MILDDKIDRFQRVRRDLQALQHRARERHAGVGVALDALALADIMQE